MAQTAYYLKDFSDEHMPCGTCLLDWSIWLSKPDEEWDRAEAAKEGEEFEAFVYEFHQVSAVRKGTKMIGILSAAFGVGVASLFYVEMFT